MQLPNLRHTQRMADKHQHWSHDFENNNKKLYESYTNISNSFDSRYLENDAV